MFRMDATSIVVPAGASSTAARNSAAFKDARRKLPAIPSIFAIPNTSPAEEQDGLLRHLRDYARGAKSLRDMRSTFKLRMHRIKIGEQHVASRVDCEHL